MKSYFGPHLALLLLLWAITFHWILLFENIFLTVRKACPLTRKDRQHVRRHYRWRGLFFGHEGHKSLQRPYGHSSHSLFLLAPQALLQRKRDVCPLMAFMMWPSFRTGNDSRLQKRKGKVRPFGLLKLFGRTFHSFFSYDQAVITDRGSNRSKEN